MAACNGILEFLCFVSEVYTFEIVEVKIVNIRVSVLLIVLFPLRFLFFLGRFAIERTFIHIIFYRATSLFQTL